MVTMASLRDFLSRRKRTRNTFVFFVEVSMLSRKLRHLNAGEGDVCYQTSEETVDGVGKKRSWHDQNKKEQSK